MPILVLGLQATPACISPARQVTARISIIGEGSEKSPSDLDLVILTGAAALPP